MKTEMPAIDINRIEGLSASELELVQGIISGQGINKGRLRASKPNVERHAAGRDRYGLMCYEPDARQGAIAYIWRMVAFSISPKSEHHCMPCTADFDVPGSYGEEKRARLTELDRIADAVVNSVNKSEWHGVRRWGQVYGMIGTPQVAPDGAIIYR